MLCRVEPLVSMCSPTLASSPVVVFLEIGSPANSLSTDALVVLENSQPGNARLHAEVLSLIPAVYSCVVPSMCTFPPKPTCPCQVVESGASAPVPRCCLHLQRFTSSTCQLCRMTLLFSVYLCLADVWLNVDVLSSIIIATPNASVDIFPRIQACQGSL